MDSGTLPFPQGYADSPGSRLKQLRKQLKLRQRSFAQQLSISQSTLSQIENDYYRPSFESLQRLMYQFDINCNWLIAGKGKPFQKIDTARYEIGSIAFVHAHTMSNYSLNLHRDDGLRYTLPGFSASPDRRIFQYEDINMEPYVGLGDYLIADLFHGDPRQIINEVVVCLHQDRMRIYRLSDYKEDDNVLCLSSDNFDFEELQVPRQDILQIWVGKGLLSKKIPSSDHFKDQKIKQLEAQLAKLNKSISNNAKRF